MENKLRALLAWALVAFALPLAASQRTETVTLGTGAMAAFADPATGKVFVALEGRGRAAPALAVLERGGRLSTLPLAGGAVAMAGSATLRKLVIVQSGAVATLVHLDSLKMTPVALPAAPSRVIVSERTGQAYVLARQARDAVVTAIDLKTLVARTGVVRDLEPLAIAADAAAQRVYVLGVRGEPGAGFVQALDAATLEPVMDALAVGMGARDIAVSAAGDTIAVLDHAEGANGTLRAQLRLLAPSLATQGIVPLPEGRFADTRGAAIEGDLLAEPSTGRWWIRDATNARIDIVGASGAVTAVDLEARPTALAANPAAGTVLAVMAQSGQAAVLSPAGERLDTVIVGHAAAADAAAAPWAIATDAASGDAFVGHPSEGVLTLLPREAERATVANITDLWVDPAEPGWGVFVEQQSTTAFATLFTYGGAGEATWLVMSNGARQAEGSFSGVLYRTQGAAQAGAAGVAPAGFMRLTPTVDGLTLNYVVDGSSATRKLQRFAFERAPRACRWTAGLAPTPVAGANFTALWSNPGDPGWGLAVSHQKQSVFAVLFTYDDQNRPAWMVMSNGRQQAPGQFGGELYRISRAKVESVGAMTLRFGASDEGVVAYRMDGTEFRSPLLRHRFAPLVSRCGA